MNKYISRTSEIAKPAKNPRGSMDGRMSNVVEDNKSDIENFLDEVLCEDLISIGKLRNLTDEQMKKSKTYRVYTLQHGLVEKYDEHISGRTLSDMLESLTNETHIYIGNMVYCTHNIIKIERVEK